MNRRNFLRRLVGTAALTAAGVYVPTKTYSFLWNNPLADVASFDAALKQVDGPMLVSLLDDETYVNQYFRANAKLIPYTADPDAGGTVFFS